MKEARPPKKQRQPIPWLGENMGRKMWLTLAVLAVLAAVALWGVTRPYLSALLRSAYDTVLTVPEEQALRALRGYALWALILVDAVVFLLVGFAIYLILLKPIVQLRSAMRRYYEQDEKPRHTTRRDEVGRIQNAFADLVEAVESKELAQRRLIASISHDLKTPLTSVIGYSERLRDSTLSPEKRQVYQERIYEQAMRIRALVDAFDDYLDTGLQSGSTPMSLTTAQALCEKLEQEYAAELSDAGVTLHIRCDAPEAKLICSWEHLRHLFGNLISNALHHADVRPLVLELTCCREGGWIVFRFSDNGKGVPEELIEEIFQPLYTSDKGRKVSGLGLSICRSIAKAHGGTLVAQNRAEGGLELVLRLPNAM